MWCMEENLNISLKNYQKIYSKIHLHVKIIFVKKDLQSFSKTILLVC